VVESVVLPDTTEVRDIAALDGGLLIGADQGVLQAPDNESFSEPSPPERVHAVTESAVGAWAGGEDLFLVGSAASISPFGRDDDKIRALAGEGSRVWVGGDDQGIALLEDSVIAARFNVDDGLPSNRIRALAIDVGGDVWAATDKGIARYKNDRGVWLTMDDQMAELEGLVDVSGIAVLDAGGQRLVAIGAGGGIAIMGL